MNKEDIKRKVNERKLYWFGAHSPIARQYDEFCYATVYNIRPNIYSIIIPCTHNMGDVWLHLIVGRNKAFLIDTGFGIGNLKGLVTKLSQGKELIVVNTHCHGDHSLGNSQFDAVHIHKFDVPALIHQMNPNYVYEFNHIGEVGIENHYYKDSDILSFNKYNIIPCDNHTEFDLGEDHKIILIHIGGHCAGSSVFLDTKNRILFSGDAILPFANGAKGAKSEYSNDKYFCSYCTLSTYNNGLKDLICYLPLIDTIFPSHGFLELDKGIISEIYDGIKLIIENPSCFDEEGLYNNKNCKFKVLANTVLFYTNETI